MNTYTDFATTTLFANPNINDDLIRMFKKAFPSGLVVSTGSIIPSLRIDGNYTTTYAGVFALLSDRLNY